MSRLSGSSSVRATPIARRTRAIPPAANRCSSAASRCAQACAEMRTLFLEEAARRLGCAAAELAVRDGRILRNGAATQSTTGRSRHPCSLAAEATGTAARKPVVGLHDRRPATPRASTCRRKCSAADVRPRHGARRHVACARGAPAAIAAPRSGRSTKPRSGARRAVRSSFVRHGDFLAIVGDDETAVEAAAVAAADPRDLARRRAAQSAAAAGDLAAAAAQHRPHHRRAAIRCRARRCQSRGDLHARLSGACLDRAVLCARRLSRRAPDGVDALRRACFRCARRFPACSSSKHRQSRCATCRGRAATATTAPTTRPPMRRSSRALLPGQPIRVRWRREEEFAFEPVSPAMVVKVRAALDDAGQPVDWTTEIWSGTHSARPGSGAPARRRGAARAAARSGADRRAGCRRRRRDAQRRRRSTTSPAKRIIHHLVPETPMRTSALRGLGAMPNVFAIECFIDELAERAGQDPVAYRLAHHVRPAGARA